MLSEKTNFGMGEEQWLELGMYPILTGLSNCLNSDIEKNLDD